MKLIEAQFGFDDVGQAIVDVVAALHWDRLPRIAARSSHGAQDGLAGFDAFEETVEVCPGDDPVGRNSTVWPIFEIEQRREPGCPRSGARSSSGRVT